jgi:hypothetical protein
MRLQKLKMRLVEAGRVECGFDLPKVVAANAPKNVLELETENRRVS